MIPRDSPNLYDAILALIKDRQEERVKEEVSLQESARFISALQKIISYISYKLFWI